MTGVTITEIYLYPVKSLAGYQLQSARVDRFGLVGDRRWLVVDEGGNFLSQRERAAMALFGALAGDGCLRLTHAGAGIDVPVPCAGAVRRRVRIWKDHVEAVDAGDESAEWLAARLGIECRLVYMPDDCRRLVDGAYAPGRETVSFADGFPLMLVSQDSLDDLNGRLERPVPVNRFRPNLVVSGCGAFAEDTWQRFRIGEMEFDVAKPCARCVVPSIDQQTAERDPQINRVLAAFRRREGKIYFGQNLLYRGRGTLSVGDAVEVLA